MKFVSFLACAYLALALVGPTQADDFELDVHCVGEQAIGTWLLRVGPDSYNSDVRCFNNFDALNPGTLEKKVELKIPDIARDSEGNEGFWTLTYDEGLEIQIGGYKYFAFFDGNETDPHCERTRVGWFHRDEETNWGCFYAVQLGPDGKPAEPPAGNNVELPNPNWMFPGLLLDAVKSLLWKANDAEVFEMTTEQVNFLNSVQSSWKATLYSQFQGKKMSIMRNLAGGVHNIVIPKKSSAKNPIPRAVNHNLPKEWDWRSVGGVNYVTPVRDQGNCGSCYAVATTAMMEIRIRIKSGNSDKILLSPQHVVSCSQYSQSCKGGLPYLVGKFAEDFGVVPEECFPYADYMYPGEGPATSCSSRCEGWETTLRRFINYRYVGNYYGNCTEVGMMQELMDHGPVVIGIEVTDDLFAYQGGVYHRVDQPENGNPSKKYRWDAINHAVLLVGWGEDRVTGEPFWIVRNSWGTWWGEDGFFRIRRGTDESGTESLAMAADPILT